MGSTSPFRVCVMPAMASGLAVALAGCGGGSSAGGTPPSASKSACNSMRAELTKMENRGLPALVERQKAGGKLSKPQKADIKAYNDLLNDYLGGRCHT